VNEKVIGLASTQFTGMSRTRKYPGGAGVLGPQGVFRLSQWGTVWRIYPWLVSHGEYPEEVGISDLRRVFRQPYQYTSGRRPQIGV